MVAEGHIEKEFNNFLHSLKATEKQPVIDTIILVIEETVGSYTKVHDIVYELTDKSQSYVHFFTRVTKSPWLVHIPDYIDVYFSRIGNTVIHSVEGSYKTPTPVEISKLKTLANIINAIDSNGKGLRVKNIVVAVQSKSTPIHYIVKLNNTYENVDVFAGCKPIQL